nr:tyrosine-type recombinase/integrase [Paludisphaera mucosa]
MDPATVRLATTVLTQAAGFVVPGGKFGTLPVVDVRLRHLESIVAQWSNRPGVRPGSFVSSSYLATATGLVRTAFRWSVRPGGGLEPLLGADPFAGFRAPTSRPARVAICDRKDAAKWLRWLRAQPRTEASGDFTLLQRCLIATGARPSEFYRATWGEIRWDAGRTEAGATYGVLTRLLWKNSRKSDKPRRIILLPSVLRPLRRLYTRINPAPDSLIFRSSTRKPWDPSMLAQATARLRRAAVAAAVDLGALGGEGEGRARGYLWRHVAASRLVMAGVDLVTVGELLGTSADMIAKTYGHLRDEHVVAAATTLGSAGRGVTNGPSGSGPKAVRPGP